MATVWEMGQRPKASDANSLAHRRLTERFVLAPGHTGFVCGEHPNKPLINEQGVKALAPHSLPQLSANDFWEEQLGTILWGRGQSWTHVSSLYLSPCSQHSPDSDL